jgi:hypothetical protein
MGRDKETGRDKVEDTARDNVKEIDRAKDSKTIRDYSKSQLKETDRNKIKETGSDSGAIMQTKNSKNNQRLLKEPGERDGQKQN